MKYSDERVKIVSWIEDELTGKNIKQLTTNPLDEIHIGFLYPKLSEKKAIDNPTTNKNTPPSSVGFSFYIKGENSRISVLLNASKYEKYEGIAEYWEKKPLANDEGEEIEITPPSDLTSNATANETKTVLGSNALLTCLWRKHNNGFLVTLSLANKCEVSSFSREAIAINRNTLFDIQFSAQILEGELLAYPSKEPSLLTEEERELEFRYRNVNIYGIGHAVSLDWFKETNGNMVLSAAFMPKVEVPSVTANTASGKSDNLNFKYLSAIHKSDEVLDSLKNFVLNYENWIKKESEELKYLSEHDKETVKNLASKMNKAKERMLRGVEFLKENEPARMAFAYTNAAMLKQMNPNKKIEEIVRVKKQPSRLLRTVEMLIASMYIALL